MLSETRFNILSGAATGEGLPDATAATPEQAADLAWLREAGYLDGGTVTPAGLEALEPYRVKRAIFFAAGLGSRMRPITLNTPKPLVRVRGKRIIDGLLDACLAAGIDDIYIVRGYLGEQFDQLLCKYPMIKFIDNPDYAETNNITSALRAGELLSGAYVIHTDLVLYNPRLIRKYHYASNMCGIWVTHTDDWHFRTKDGIITAEIRQGIEGSDCYLVVGIHYWDPDTGSRLAGDLRETFAAPGGERLFYEQVVFGVYPEKYKIRLRECAASDVTEIDTYAELCALDDAYRVR